MSSSQAIEPVTDKLEPNPLAEIMEDLCGHVEREIYSLVDDAFGRDTISDGLNNDGTIWGKGSSFARRPATNTECAKLNVDVSLQGAFDRQRPLPRQVAKWLRSQAMRLYRAAELVETVRDNRDRKFVKRLVHEDGFAEIVAWHNVWFDVDGTPFDKKTGEQIHYWLDPADGTTTPVDE